jgi:hypothetical protein
VFWGLVWLYKCFRGVFISERIRTTDLRKKKISIISRQFPHERAADLRLSQIHVGTERVLGKGAFHVTWSAD